METVYYVVMVPMFYLACAVFIGGAVFQLVKVLQAPRNPSTLKIYPDRGANWLRALADTFLFPTVLRHKPLLWVFLIVFHISLLLLVLGHLELLDDVSLLQVIEHEIFLGKGWVGLAAIVSVLFFLFRRIKSPVREMSAPMDYLLLLLFLLAALFGSQMDWARTWYGFDGMAVEDYREYLTSLILLRPEVPYNVESSGHAFMLAAHVFFANLFLMIFPFSHLMHAIFALPMNKLRRG